MCGIFAIYDNNYNKNIKDLYHCLKKLQHRGKDGYGIVYLLDNISLVTTKDEGEIKSELFNRVNEIKCKSCIGHLRYSTSGASIENGSLKRTELQPIRGYNIQTSGPFYIAHNGNIPNVKNHDTTYIRNLLEESEGSMKEKLIKMINDIPAAFSIVILTHDNKMYILRDRFGIRPLCLGKKNDKYYISSESCAFSNDVNFIRDVKPGELIRIDETGLKTLYLHPESVLNLCTFEILYFLNENSYVDGLQIKNVRRHLGRLLAIKEDIIDTDSKDEYVVVGIPLTGILYGKSYANALDIRYSQLVHKNKKSSRTFIILDNEERKKACDKKFNYDNDAIKDKKIIIVDDTIVRGNIIKSIIKSIRKCGAKEIHVRIPGPPVIDICELGISIQTKEELIMNNNNIEGVCKEIDADSLKYLDVSELEHFPQNTYNQCFTGYINPIIKSVKLI